MKNKFHLLLSLATFYILVFSACGNSTETTTSLSNSKIEINENVENGFTFLKSKYKNFSVNIPENWEVKQDRKTGTIRVKRPYDAAKQKEYKENVFIHPRPAQVKLNKTTGEMEPQKIDIQTFAKNHFTAIEGTLKNFKSIELGETIIGGKKAKKYVYSFNQANEHSNTLQSSLYILEHDNDAYLISSTDDKVETSTSGPLLNKIINSIQFY